MPFCPVPWRAGRLHRVDKTPVKQQWEPRPRPPADMLSPDLSPPAVRLAEALAAFATTERLVPSIQPERPPASTSRQLQSCLGWIIDLDIRFL